ncbi:nitrite reductase NiiA [Aspergillus luchuensis]|uniref:Nitrite reductase NiiA n=1 Tax=Aspergillus kawachii TaxID=1069201 RepID=A0A146FIM4_ASPKA|nr:nitrite reductase NiiA [Aspergillus luchuensis]
MPLAAGDPNNETVRYSISSQFIAALDGNAESIIQTTSPSVKPSAVSTKPQRRETYLNLTTIISM